MSHRTVLISALLAMGSSLFGLAGADIIAVDSGIAVKESDGAAPARGMTMSQVSSKFGAPSSKVAAVGNPPISRWEYPGFVVYFEHDHVIHSVVSEMPAAPPAPADQPQPPAAGTPQATESASPGADSAAAAEPPPTP